MAELSTITDVVAISVNEDVKKGFLEDASELMLRLRHGIDYDEAIGSVGGTAALGALNQGDGDSGTLLKRSNGNVMVYKADPTTPYDDIYVRFRLVNTGYDERFYYDEHGDGGEDVYAWTQPFFARKRIK
jgi:hypothetical protein